MLVLLAGDACNVRVDSVVLFRIPPDQCCSVQLTGMLFGKEQLQAAIETVSK